MSEQIGQAGWSPNYGDNYIQIDEGFKRNEIWSITTTENDATTYFDTTTSYSSADNPPFEIGTADPASCDHEWWEDTGLTYTTNPPARRQLCKLCGETRLRYMEVTPFARWEKVED